MHQLFATLTAALTIVATPATFAAAEPTPDTSTAIIETGVRYTLIDAWGRPVGEVTAVAMPRVHTADARTADRVESRTFHPNFHRALSAGQMSDAWQAEIDRIMPQPVSGGG